MAVKSVFRPKGLNLRLNDIERPVEYAKDCNNVVLNAKGELIKRPSVNNIGSEGVNDLISYKKGNELISLKNISDPAITGHTLTNVLTGDAIISGNSTMRPSWSGKVDYAEYSGCVYITDPRLEQELFKYDGSNVYRAGMPKTRVSINYGTGTPLPTISLRFVYRMTDYQGNVYWGDYSQIDSEPGNSIFDYTAQYELEDGFNDKYLYRAGTIGGSQDLENGVNDTIEYTTTNLEIGDFITNDTNFGRVVGFKVTGKTASEITFDLSKLQDGETSIFKSSGGYVYSNVRLYIFVADNPNFGFKLLYIDKLFRPDMIYSSPVFNFGATIADIFAGNSSAADMEDYIDTTIVYGLPPKCKYITVFNNVCVLANQLPTNQLNTTSGGVMAENSSLDDFIHWSDLGLGYTFETFPPFNNTPIGKTNEGDVTGLFADSDSVTVFKSNAIYSVYGNLVTQNFRITKNKSSGIGCVNFKTIQEIDGICYFLSQKGLHAIQGAGLPVEISDKIEPYFKGITDFSDSQCILDYLNEKLYIYIDSSNFIVYDFYYKDFFPISGDSNSFGFGYGAAYFNNEVYFTPRRPGSFVNVYKFGGNNFDDWWDNGDIKQRVIPAYWQSGWDYRQSPSVKSKYTDLVLYSMSNDEWEATVDLYFDWLEETDNVSELITFEADTFRFEQINLNKGMANSASFRISNENNEPMLFTGFEYQVADTQDRFKL